MAEQGFSRRRAAGLLLAGVVAFAAACAPVFRNTGYVPTEDELALLVIGSDSRETVGATIGRPGTAGLLNDVGWYYVQSRWKHSGALPPRELDRQVVAITFNDAGVVENIERFGLDKGKVVVLSRRVTDSNIKGVSFLRQLFGNIGRLTADQVLQ